MTHPPLPALDHVVLLVRDLDAAARWFGTQGFTVLRRADREEKPGSIFRFVSFTDGSYLLLNAFTAEAMARHRLGPVLAEREGPGDWSVCVADLDAATARGRAAALTIGPETAVRNVLSGGEAWGLRLLLSGRGSGGDHALPFLVQDTEGRAARIPGPVDHPNGATGIAGVTIASGDPGRSAAALAALLDLPAPTGTGLTIGAARIDFIPTDPAAGGTARMGGPVAVTLATPAGPLTLDSPAGGGMDNDAPMRLRHNNRKDM